MMEVNGIEEPEEGDEIEDVTEDECEHSTFSRCFRCRLPRPPEGPAPERYCPKCRKGIGLCHCWPSDL